MISEREFKELCPHFGILKEHQEQIIDFYDGFDFDIGQGQTERFFNNESIIHFLNDDHKKLIRHRKLSSAVMGPFSAILSKSPDTLAALIEEIVTASVLGNCFIIRREEFGPPEYQFLKRMMDAALKGTI
jgi:hypothetical protein